MFLPLLLLYQAVAVILSDFVFVANDLNVKVIITGKL